MRQPSLRSAGLHPTRKAGTVTPDEVRRLHAAIRGSLRRPPAWMAGTPSATCTATPGSTGRSSTSGQTASHARSAGRTSSESRSWAAPATSAHAAGASRWPGGSGWRRRFGRYCTPAQHQTPAHGHGGAAAWIWLAGFPQQGPLGKLTFQQCHGHSCRPVCVAARAETATGTACQLARAAGRPRRTACALRPRALYPHPTAHAVVGMVVRRRSSATQAGEPDGRRIPGGQPARGRRSHRRGAVRHAVRLGRVGTSGSGAAAARPPRRRLLGMSAMVLLRGAGIGLRRLSGRSPAIHGAERQRECSPGDLRHRGRLFARAIAAQL